MSKIFSTIKDEHYKVEIHSPTGNVLVADEPVDMGGKDKGFSPKEVLAAALAACTSATLRMYADGKAWPLKEVKLSVEVERDDATGTTTIDRQIEFVGDLDEGQRKRLLSVAKACPMHKILTGSIEINTRESDSFKEELTTLLAQKKS